MRTDNETALDGIQWIVAPLIIVASVLAGELALALIGAACFGVPYLINKHF